MLNQPHLYCLIADGGEPYEGFVYYVWAEDRTEFFPENDEQFDYAEELGLKKDR